MIMIDYKVKEVNMRIQAVTNFSAIQRNAMNSKNVRKNNAENSISLPKTVDVKQNLTNPTFKNCGATQAAALAGCSIFGIT